MKKADGSDYRHSLSPALLSQSKNPYIAELVLKQWAVSPGSDIQLDLVRDLKVRGQGNPPDSSVMSKDAVVQWLASKLPVSELSLATHLATEVYDVYGQQMFYFFTSVVAALQDSHDLGVAGKSQGSNKSWEAELFVDENGIVNVQARFSSAATVNDVNTHASHEMRGDATVLYQLIGKKFVYVDGACDNDLVHAMALSGNLTFKNVQTLNQYENFLLFERLNKGESENVAPLVDITDELNREAELFQYELTAEELNKSSNLFVQDFLKPQPHARESLKKDANRGVLRIEGKLDRLEDVPENLVQRYLERFFGDKSKAICDDFQQFYMQLIPGALQQAILDSAKKDLNMGLSPVFKNNSDNYTTNLYQKGGKVFHEMHFFGNISVRDDQGNLEGELTGECKYTFEVTDQGYKLESFKTNNEVVHSAILGLPLRALTSYEDYDTTNVLSVDKDDESAALNSVKPALTRAEQLRQFFGITEAENQYAELKKAAGEISPNFSTFLKVLSVAKYIFSFAFITAPLKNTYDIVKTAWTDHLKDNENSVAASLREKPLKTMALGVLFAAFSLGRFVVRSVFSPKLAVKEAWQSGNRLLAVASLVTTVGIYFLLAATGLGVMLAFPQMPGVIGGAMSTVFNGMASMTGGLATAVAATVTTAAAIALMVFYSVGKLPSTILTKYREWKDKQNAVEEEQKNDTERRPSQSLESKNDEENANEEKTRLLSNAESSSSSKISASLMQALPSVVPELKSQGWVIDEKESRDDVAKQSYRAASAEGGGRFQIYKEKITSKDSADTAFTDRVKTFEAQLKVFKAAHPNHLPEIKADRELNTAWVQACQNAGYDAKIVDDKVTLSMPNPAASASPKPS